MARVRKACHHLRPWHLGRWLLLECTNRRAAGRGIQRPKCNGPKVVGLVFVAAFAPDLERFCAKRAGAKVTEIESSHVVMLSHPKEVLNIIKEAATTAK